MKRRNQRGNTLVEFALCFSLLVPLFAGLFQFGYTFWVYNQLQSAVHAGSRYAANLTYDSPNAVPSAAYASAVRNAVVYGSPRGGATAIVPGLTPAHVRVEMIFAHNAPATVVVDIDGLPIASMFKTYTMTGKPRAAFPYLGRWAPV